MYPTINTDYCKGCNLCVEVCPKKVFETGRNITHRGYYAAVVSFKEQCTNFKIPNGGKPLCEICWLTCPEHAIEFKGD
ncbi:MAG: 4Fe-4S dicluster domain-containing protein [Thermoplasmata archaeon]|jgi:2-oxoglutarate ferredoxin oxidoreductase subunit delta|nr:MAG: 4Fe-4S ferredoxin [Aciduliprofundum sp.]HEU12652.1 ferredoxin family protein [Euryarchaeota archaeon]